MNAELESPGIEPGKAAQAETQKGGGTLWKGKEKGTTLEIMNTVVSFIPYVQGMRLVKAKAIYCWR